MPIPQQTDFESPSLAVQLRARKDPRRHVLILASFFGSEGAWIDDFSDRPDLEFKKVPYPKREDSWHARGRVTSATEWLWHARYVYTAMKWPSDCVVTCFPQLALVTAALLRLQGNAQRRLVAWNFNLGSLSGSWRGRISGSVLDRVDCFVVHAREEIRSYASWLGIAERKFRFVPLQRGRIETSATNSIAGPYIVSMGSANRDYSTLVEAVRGTGIKTILIGKKSLLDALPEAPEIVKLHGLSQKECEGILGMATLSVVPLLPTSTASGQVTLVTSMRMGVATIATNCIGTVDYVQHGETGLLVPPGEWRALRQAIESLWRNDVMRRRIASNGQVYAEEYFSDEAAGRHLSEVIDQVLAP